MVLAGGGGVGRGRAKTWSVNPGPTMYESALKYTVILWPVEYREGDEGRRVEGVGVVVGVGVVGLG